MLHHPTLDKLQALRFTGMLKALQEQQQLPDIDTLSFEERLGLLVDREMTEREDRRLQTRLRKAQLKHQAAIEDIDYRTPRGLDKGLMRQLSGCHWVKEGLNLIINGPTGVGKTWIACALAHKACREGYSAQYLRLPRLFEALHLAHGDGTAGLAGQSSSLDDDFFSCYYCLIFFDSGFMLLASCRAFIGSGIGN